MFLIIKNGTKSFSLTASEDGECFALPQEVSDWTNIQGNFLDCSLDGFVRMARSSGEGEESKIEFIGEPIALIN